MMSGESSNELERLRARIVELEAEQSRRNNVELQLRISESRYKNLIKSIPDIIYELDKDGIFVFVSDSISQFNFNASDLVGKHFKEIIHPDDYKRVSRIHVLGSYEGIGTGPEGSPKLFDERRTGKRMTKNLEVRLRINYADNELSNFSYAEIFSSGNFGHTEVHSSGRWDRVGEKEQNEFLGSIGIIRDITERKWAEDKIQATLAEKEVLLREIHHRVKNNLQVISSILDMSSLRTTDEGASHLFEDAIAKIHTMALLHSQIYRSDDLLNVNMKKYIEDLLVYLKHFYNARDKLNFSVDIDPEICLTLYQGVPFTLILTELVANACTHAFKGKKEGNVGICFKKGIDDFVILHVIDNGVGIPDEIDFMESNTLGLKLTRNLVHDQLKGTIDFIVKEGTEVTVIFRIVKKEIGSEQNNGC